MTLSGTITAMVTPFGKAGEVDYGRLEAIVEEQVTAGIEGICAVGTTVQRALETGMGADKRLKEFDGWTNRFIYPPYEFGLANAMVANFYTPYSTLLMLTCAYGGYDLVMKGYKEALRDVRYRFGTYGDAMLILND